MTAQAKLTSTWLFVCCAMIFIMVALGGATRLTESGLSITEWKPVSGIIPPLNETEWQAQFDLYKQIPQYRLMNSNITLDDYKTIFWWEYAHRVWGRLIGLAFFLPLVFFWAKGYLHKDWKPALIVLLILGANQGFLGWIMVQSGLEGTRTSVSPYRLTAHLTLAAVIYAYMLWVALHIKNYFSPKGPGAPFLRKPTLLLFALFWLTFIMGGFMAGTHSGLLYKTFPLYNGEAVPGGLLAMQPWYANFFENSTTIHFTHRSLAILLVLGSIALAAYGWRAAKPVKVPLIHVAAMALVQMALGISTIAREVPVLLGTLHQAGSILLLTFFIWLLFRLSR